MGNPGKVIQITARPAETADLAVEVDGIVGSRIVQLGDSVTAFDFAGFYALLGSTIAGSPAKLKFTSQGIRSHGPVASSALLTLRAESLKATLDKAILARENTFYSKYGRPVKIAGIFRKWYGPKQPQSKLARLGRLSQLALEQNDLLQTAYVSQGRTGVVKSTTSQLTGYSTGTGHSWGSSATEARNTSDVTGTGEDGTNTVSTHEGMLTFEPEDKPAKSVTSSDNLTDDTIGPSAVVTTGDPRVLATKSQTRTLGSSKSHESSLLSGGGESLGLTTESSDETQTVINTGYDYHVPSIEAMAQHERAQISLIDEQVEHLIEIEKLPYLQKIFENELKMIDLDVKLLQVAYLNTILLPPITGIVTGVFADVGDSVRAGEVLVRVENNTKVFLEATLVYRGSVSVGDTVTVQTDLFSKSGNSVTISGTVVAARSDSGDDRWNIIVSCDNRDSNGQDILPLYYNFDYDNTSITIA